jgi:hypothetical protein
VRPERAEGLLLEQGLGLVLVLELEQVRKKQVVSNSSHQLSDCKSKACRLLDLSVAPNRQAVVVVRLFVEVVLGHWVQANHIQVEELHNLVEHHSQELAGFQVVHHMGNNVGRHLCHLVVLHIREVVRRSLEVVRRNQVEAHRSLEVVLHSLEEGHHSLEVVLRSLAVGHRSLVVGHTPAVLHNQVEALHSLEVVRHSQEVVRHSLVQVQGPDHAVVNDHLLDGHRGDHDRLRRPLGGRPLGAHRGLRCRLSISNYELFPSAFCRPTLSHKSRKFHP